jgi:hypothetical protein
MSADETERELRDVERAALSEGRLVSGFEGRLCANSVCRVPLNLTVGAYLHRDRASDRLILFCEACSHDVQLHAALRFPFVAL